MEDIHEIKQVIETPVLTQDIIKFFWLFFGLVIFLFIVLIVYYISKKMKIVKKDVKKLNHPIEEDIDYYEIAKNKIKKAKKYMENKEYVLLYSELSKIVKEYLGYVYHESFVDMTTEEILNINKFSIEDLKNTKNFFRKIDLAKFAKKRQEDKDAKIVYELAILVIK